MGRLVGATEFSGGGRGVLTSLGCLGVRTILGSPEFNSKYTSCWGLLGVEFEAVRE
jgi:hypothetical protein